MENKTQIIADPGCQKATELYQLIKANPQGNHTLSLALIEVHKQGTQKHSPDCLVSRSTQD